MVVKTPLKFGCATLTLARRTLSRNKLLTKCYPLCRLSYVGLNPARGCHRSREKIRPATYQPDKWHFEVDIERAKNKEKQMSLPMLMYLYSPWQMFTTKFNLWKLKLLWDWKFAEAEFVENAQQAMVVVNKFILEERERYIKRCTTPMGYKQIKHDLLKTEMHYKWPSKIMCFEKRHIRRAITLKVQRLQHYDHKFAFVDMIFLACRRVNDFDSQWEEREIRDLIAKFADTDKVLVPDPIIFAEYFVRFRRDYSLPPTVRAGHWLISTYKVLQLDVLNYHPEFDVDSGKRSKYISVEPLSSGTRAVKHV